MAKLGFPDQFLWGVATSAQQIEGGRHEGGRGESIWDRFAATGGAIEDGSTPDVACDHFHLWREDLERLRWLGVGAYRFSIAWPRIFPEGAGKVATAGLDFYEALVDALLESGIRPFPTLYHWDLPQALQERGGWATRETVESFVNYTTKVVERLGDRVDHWVTHNEPWCIATLGHEEGHHAPGHRDPAEALRVAHHVLLAHGRATEAIRSLAPRASVGIVTMHVPVHPATQSEPDHDAARALDGFFNRWYLDPLFRGWYPEDVVADRVACGHLPDSGLPFALPGDLDTIATPVDFLGINYYSRLVARAGDGGRPEAVAVAPPEERTDMGWEVYPDGMEETLLRLHRDYAPPALYVTENGAAYDDPIDERGRCVDARRIEYLRTHLQAAHRAIAHGVPLRGYFAWSLMDNFEWGHGYARRFGLFAVDFRTRERIRRDSAAWYRDVVTCNAVETPVETGTRGETREIEL